MVVAVSVLGGAADAEVPDAPAPATADTHGSGELLALSDRPAEDPAATARQLCTAPWRGLRPGWWLPAARGQRRRLIQVRGVCGGHSSASCP